MTGRDKFIVVALLGLLVVASVVAIVVDQRTGPGDPAVGGTYVEGVASVPQFLNPVIASTDVDEDVARLAFSGLTRYDQTGAIVPDLAAAFRTESDGKVWTFDIRDDATWQDGQPVTADDVVYTVKLLQDRGYVGQDAERARALKNVVLYSLPTDNFVALFLNVRPEKAAFREKAVRQAIATAIDRGKVLQVAADGRGTLADEFVPPSSWAYVKDVTKYPFSTDDAKALLDNADWKDHDGDGIRDKGGQKLAFTITTSDEPARRLAASQIQSDLNAIGMKVDVKTMPFGELVDSAARQRNFDALLVEIAVP